VRGPPYYNAHAIRGASWVGIDARGLVGTFECGEAGAVPLPWPLGSAVDRHPLDLLCTARALETGALLGVGRPRIGERAVVSFDPAAASATYRDGGRTSTFEAAIGAESVLLRESGPRVIATRRALDGALVAALERDPTVARVLSEHEVTLWLGARRDTGVFRWRNVDADAVGLYTRTDPPSRPIHVDELPSIGGEVLGVVRFDVGFADAATLQLADHFPRAELVTRAPSDSLRRRAPPPKGPRTL
jgi:hypothetical protein